jgi:hypothetical protein
MMFRILWGVVGCWAAIVLCGIVYYGVRWFSETANPARNELLFGATISVSWILPALLLALVLTFSPAARDATAQRVAWRAVVAVLVTWGLLVAVASMTV